MFSRRKIGMIVAEFLGAAILSVALYTIIARTSFPLFTALAVGTTYAVLVLLLGNVADVQANPAATLGLWVIRKTQTLQAIAYIAAQLLGGLAALALIGYFLGHKPDSLASSRFEWKILIAEAIGAAVFLFGVAAAKYQNYEGAKLAAALGFSLFVGVLIASIASNAIINPAVAIGVHSWDWAYGAGPLVGGVVGVGVYSLLYAPARVVKKGKAKK
jgi:aquaporin Z